jgi:hypothetical protein
MTLHLHTPLGLSPVFLKFNGGGASASVASGNIFLVAKPLEQCVKGEDGASSASRQILTMSGVDFVRAAAEQ